MRSPSHWISLSLSCSQETLRVEVGAHERCLRRGLRLKGLQAHSPAQASPSLLLSPSSRAWFMIRPTRPRRSALRDRDFLAQGSSF